MTDFCETESPETESDKHSTETGWLHFRIFAGLVCFSRRAFDEKYPADEISKLLKVTGVVKISFPTGFQKAIARVEMPSLVNEYGLKCDLLVELRPGKLLAHAEGEEG